MQICIFCVLMAVSRETVLAPGQRANFRMCNYFQKKVNKLKQNHIPSKHKTGKRRGAFSWQLLSETDKRLGRRVTILHCILGLFPGDMTQCRRGCCFSSLKTLQDTVMKLNQIQEAQNIKAHSLQESMMFFSSSTVRKSYKAQSNQGST